MRSCGGGDAPSPRHASCDVATRIAHSSSPGFVSWSDLPMNRRRQRRRFRDASVTLEFILVLPLLVVTLFAVAQFTVALLVRQAVTPCRHGRSTRSGQGRGYQRSGAGGGWRARWIARHRRRDRHDSRRQLRLRPRRRRRSLPWPIRACGCGWRLVNRIRVALHVRLRRHHRALPCLPRLPSFSPTKSASRSRSIWDAGRCATGCTASAPTTSTSARDTSGSVRSSGKSDRRFRSSASARTAAGGIPGPRARSLSAFPG